MNDELWRQTARVWIILPLITQGYFKVYRYMYVYSIFIQLTPTKCSQWRSTYELKYNIDAFWTDLDVVSFFHLNNHGILTRGSWLLLRNYKLGCRCSCIMNDVIIKILYNSASHWTDLDCPICLAPSLVDCPTCLGVLSLTYSPYMYMYMYIIIYIYSKFSTK